MRDAAFIAACNPQTIAALLVAFDAKEAEIARLRADAERMREQLDEANTALDAIGDYAHDRSGGPTVWDPLWEVRSMAYNAVQPIAIDKARSATSGEAS